MDRRTFFRTFPSSYSSHSRHQNATCGGSPLVVRYASTCSEISSGVSRSSAYCFLKRLNASPAAVANPFRQLLRRDEIYVTKDKMKTYEQENTCQTTPRIAFLNHMLAFSENVVHNLLDLVMVEPGPRSDGPSLQLCERDNILRELLVCPSGKMF